MAGRPSFNALQNYGSSQGPLLYYLFDVLILGGKEVISEPLDKRRALLETRVLPKLSDPIRYSPELKGSMRDLIPSIKAQSLEGLVAKRRDSPYEPGLRSGAWRKMRINQGQELVIGGYTPSASSFDALVIGYYEQDSLIYAARTRNRFTPASRLELFQKLKPLETTECPFSNLPEAKSGRWGAGLTAAKMKDCRWLKPEIVGQFEFVEWTDVNHLRHTKLIALREDKNARDLAFIHESGTFFGQACPTTVPGAKSRRFVSGTRLRTALWNNKTIRTERIKGDVRADYASALTN